MRQPQPAPGRRPAALELILIVNEKAREAASGELTPAVLERKLAARGLSGRVVVVGRDEETAAVAERQARAGAGVVVAVGGDGTIHGVAVGLYRAGGTAALGIVPAGSMNNIAASLGIPEELDAALDLLAVCLVRGVRRPMDLGLIFDRLFVESSGFGIVSDLLCLGESVKQRPLTAPAAIPELARLLGRYRPAPVTLILDGQVRRTRAMHVRICNTPAVGLRIIAAPNARTDDGILDVVVYEQFGTIELLAYLLRKIGGTRIRNARVRRYRAREIVVEPSEAWPIDLDGELIGECGPGHRWRRIEARVLPAALTLCAPPEQPHIAENPLQTVLRALPAVPEVMPEAVGQAAVAAEQALAEVAIGAEHAVTEAAMAAEHAVVEAAAAAEQALAGVTESPGRAARRATVIRGMYMVGGALALVASIAARRMHVLPGDLELTRAFQRTRSPLADRFWTAIAWGGFPKESMALVAATTLGLWLARFRLEAAFFLVASGVNVVNFAVKRVVRRQRPMDTVVRVTRLIREPSFPSGHVMHYTSTLGFVAAAALANLRPSPLRRGIVAACAALIGLVGPSRVYLGAHWPSDVAAGYLFGGLYLGGVLELYSLAKQEQARFSLPLPWRAIAASCSPNRDRLV
jgi:undecaprenyl-diphosphatase